MVWCVLIALCRLMYWRLWGWQSGSPHKVCGPVAYYKTVRGKCVGSTHYILCTVCTVPIFENHSGEVQTSSTESISHLSVPGTQYWVCMYQYGRYICRQMYLQCYSCWHLQYRYVTVSYLVLVHNPSTYSTGTWRWLYSTHQYSIGYVPICTCIILLHTGSAGT